jgi:hypothetical protein
MSIYPLSYRVVGQFDYMLEIAVGADGGYCINCGDHTSHKPRSGRLDRAHRTRLESLIQPLAKRLGRSWEYPAPEGAEGFMAELDLGDGAERRAYRFWEGALEEQPELKAVVRELEII